MANECIPLFEDGDEISATTTTAVTGKTFVAHTAALTSGAINAGLPNVGTATAAGAVAGVAAYDAAQGARVTVIRGRYMIVPVTAGAAITVLNEVEVGSGGKAVTKASGIAVGRALTTGVNNQDCMIELY